MVISEGEIVLRLLLAALLGACVGLERELRNQPAGLRTHIILALGATLAMCISIDLAMEFRPYAPNGDPARLAAQVISGIGFLGAGAILRYGTSVRGLTTATSLWTIAIVGLGVGAGHYFSAIATSILLLVALIVLDQIEKRFTQGSTIRLVSLKALDRPQLVDELKRELTELDIEIKSINVTKNLKENEVDLEATIMVLNKQNIGQLIGILSHIQGAKGFDIH
jgi:putative Mg2+ transporter-C (MgtC) family protein